MENKYWGEGKDWATESALMSWVRGGIRRSLWNRHPVKISFIKKNRIKIPNPNPRGNVKEVWGGVCAMTGELFVLKNLEVDHKYGGHSLRKIEDVQKFIEGIVFVTEDDLQFISKDAHRIKSYADRMGLSFEEAWVEKEAIAICKSKKDKQWLTERGVIPLSNAKKRREQILEVLRKERL
jgi:hypothetical protein